MAAFETTLVGLAQEFEKLDASYQHFHGKLFSFIPPHAKEFDAFIRNYELPRAAYPNEHPAAILRGRLAAVIPVHTREVPSVEAGKLQIRVELSKPNLPDCEYLALISPVEKKDKSTEYAKAFESINFMRSFLAMSFGKLPFYTWIADFEFNTKGELSVAGDTLRLPMDADFFALRDAELVSEITARLKLQQPDMRRRLQSASNFVDLAMDQKDEAFRFSSYWIALEILAGGTSDTIRSALAKAFGKRGKAFADDKLFFKEIAGVRHDLLHHGRFGVMPAYHERLLQLYFWDIAIHQLGLKPRALALALAESGLAERESAHMNDRKAEAV